MKKSKAGGSFKMKMKKLTKKEKAEGRRFYRGLMRALDGLNKTLPELDRYIAAEVARKTFST
jgi:hypothetical protein